MESKLALPETANQDQARYQECQSMAKSHLGRDSETPQSIDRTENTTTRNPSVHCKCVLVLPFLQLSQVMS